MITYLIVEDDPIKKSGYMKFGEHYGVRFIAAASPRGAIAVLENPRQREALSGVIADFELKGRRPTNHHLRIDVPGPDGANYTISTGLGVLDWVHSTDPDLPLWALTDVNAAHAPLFMSAASLWLDAKPLGVERLYQRGTPLADGMCAELQDPDSYPTANPTWKWVDESRAAFNELVQTKYSGVESFDWLNALTHLRRAPGGFIPALTNAIRQVTLDQNINAYANTLAPCMAKWQLRLEEIYQDFPVDREEDRWPTLDEDHLPGGLNVWEAFNPITDFLGDNGECQEFFEATDVRMALRKWRDRGDVF
jgi:hypothetical protein